MYTLGFIGFGNMGKAMALGAVKNGYNKEEIVFSKVSDIKAVEEETGIKGFEKNCDVAKNSKIIILAVKPYQYEKVISEIKDYVDVNSIVVPITPSFTMEEIKNFLKEM